MLSIPEPCNEDFSKMTPTERGAFCGKCKIDTFDFRDLSNQEINKILLDNKGQHLCGQFKNEQLEDLNAGFINWKNQQPKTFRSKFIMALLLVFGLSLFSCDQENKQSITNLQQLQLVQQPEAKAQFIHEVLQLPELDLLDFVQLKDDENKSAKVANPTNPVKEPITCEAVTEVNPQELVDFDERDYKTAGIPMIMGGSVAQVDYYTYLEDTVSIIDSSTTLPEKIENTVKFTSNVYPNPTHSNATVAIEVEIDGQFDVQLYNSAGNLIQIIHQGELVKGRQQFNIDLSGQAMGMYFVRILSQEQFETLKVQRI